MPGLRAYPAEMPWAIVEVRNQLFAIATEDMREMLIMPHAAEAPDLPDYIRGVVNLRGRVLPVVDLRKRMGLASMAEETEAFRALMQQREQDHRNWLNELELSVRERREFTLATDPHKCKFGQWYDRYRAENVWVAGLLGKFDAPHRAIHGVAKEVEKRKAAGQYDQAEALIASTREGLLAQLVRLFAELRDLVGKTAVEMAVVLASRDRWFAVSVDLALAIEKFPPGNIEEVPPQLAVARNSVVRRLARRAKSKEVVLLIETDVLLAATDPDAPLPGEADGCRLDASRDPEQRAAGS